MKVTIYIETTLAGPGIRDGKYGAVVEFITSRGQPITREVYGEEDSTTWHRSILMAAVKAMKILKCPCDVELIMGSSFVTNMITGGNVEAWRRSEWKKSSGEDVKNKELWQEFADLMETHKIGVTFCKYHAYKHFLLEKMKGETK